MKKLIVGLLVLVLVMASLVGCSSAPSEEVTKVEDLAGKNIGSIVWFGITDDALLEIFSTGYGTEFAAAKSFDSESALIMGLDTGKIDAAWLRDFQANAYAKDTEKYFMFSSDTDKMVQGSARMAAAADTTAANDLVKINAAIAQLQQDGTLAQLQKDYVDDFEFSSNFESVVMPKIDGAPTYKVSISGSMVPLDYIAADGNPTGFSIALLAKLSEIAKLNFELVTIGFGADRMELTSKKIDYIFCYTLTDKDMEKETDIVFSEPYFSYAGSAFLVKK